MDEPRNVVEALACVMDELPSIGKDQRMGGSQGYAYRGIEQITREVQPLFAKYRIVVVPRVESWEIRPIEVGGKPWSDAVLLVSYQFWGSGDAYADLGPCVEGHNVLTVGPFLGIGRDGSDKGSNKCLTQVFKQALLQVLCISDAKDDADSATHEADSNRAPANPLDRDRGLLYARFEGLSKADQKSYIDHQRMVEWPWIAQMTEVEIKAANEWFDSFLEEPF